MNIRLHPHFGSDADMLTFLSWLHDETLDQNDLDIYRHLNIGGLPYDVFLDIYDGPLEKLAILDNFFRYGFTKGVGAPLAHTMDRVSPSRVLENVPANRTIIDHILSSHLERWVSYDILRLVTRLTWVDRDNPGGVAR